MLSRENKAERKGKRRKENYGKKQILSGDTN